jgi:6-phosphofructokinase
MVPNLKTHCQRIGVLTSGGDCAGLNAVVRAITHYSTQHHGWTVVGIHHGLQGLLQCPQQWSLLTPQVCNEDWLISPGSRLGSLNRTREAAKLYNLFEEEKITHLRRGYDALHLDGLIAIGGDGSLKIIGDLCHKAQIPIVFIPKTIDNDVVGTEFSIGFQTAVQSAVSTLDCLASTAKSHARIMILEVMGRDTGHIALAAGIAGGAHAILIPEIPYSLETLSQHLQSQFHPNGPQFALVVVSESVPDNTGESLYVLESDMRRYGGIGHSLAHQIQTKTSFESRATVLGHVQRGAPPTYSDRMMAAALGVQAVNLVANQSWDSIVLWKDGTVISRPISEIQGRLQRVSANHIWVQTARALGIYLGEN